MKGLCVVSTYYHITTEKSIDSILKNGLIPHIGPLSESAHETDKRIYLFSNENDMHNAIDNWLIDDLENIYGEDAVFCILEVAVPDDFPITNKDVPYEYYSYRAIPPQYITLKEII